MSTFFRFVIVAILIVGIAYLVYANRKRLSGILYFHREKNPKGREKNKRDAMTEVYEAFLMYADNFQGLYEPLYKASQGSISQERMKNILIEWDLRMNNIRKAPISLKSWWATIISDSENIDVNELQTRANSIVQMILSAGIIRDGRHDLVASQETSLYYLNSMGEHWEKGQILRIESPCWYLPCTPVRIIEKGYCEII